MEGSGSLTMQTTIKPTIFLLPFLTLLLAGCGSRIDKDFDGVASGDIGNSEDSVNTDAAPIAGSSVDSASNEPAVALAPTPQLKAPLPTYVSEELSLLPLDTPAGPEPIGIFASLEDNLATGELAPDFTASMMGDWTFSMADQRGSYVLLYPTIVGCAGCVFTMDQIAQAYPEFVDMDLKVVILNLYPDDVPETWLSYVALIPGSDFSWGVVNNLDFAINYELYSLGSVILVDPQGCQVFQNQYRLTADQFRQLFSLVVEAQASG